MKRNDCRVNWALFEIVMNNAGEREKGNNMKLYDNIIAPAMAIHPGEILKDEIDARGMTQKVLAEKMGRPLQVINLIINGRKSISEDTALDLEKAFDGELTAEMWVQLDANYRLDSARLRRQERKAS